VQEILMKSQSNQRNWVEEFDLIHRCKHLETSWMNVDLWILVLWDQDSLGISILIIS